MKFVAVANQKGGVGKTTTAVNLASCLAERGLRILVVDMDPQASATSSLGVAKEPGRSIYGPFIGRGTARDCIRPTPYENLALIPSEQDLAGIENEFAHMEDGAIRLRSVLGALRDICNFNFIIIDCPPSIGAIMVNALAASDSILVPLQCEYLSLEGLTQILSVIDRIRNGLNPALQIEGVLMTMFDARTRLAQNVVNDVRAHLGDQVFATVIPRTVRLGEAPSFGQPINHYDKFSAGTAAYRALALEFLSRNGTNPPTVT
ncbi:MAG TPA: AAA family ATPase [Verrucomicrobiae bacterium]|nr:AAA family ATPase [Verrucomicrobiae bacterium]